MALFGDSTAAEGRYFLTIRCHTGGFENEQEGTKDPYLTRTMKHSTVAGS